MKNKDKELKKAAKFEKRRKRDADRFIVALYKVHNRLVELTSDELHRLKEYKRDKETYEQHVVRIYKLGRTYHGMRALLIQAITNAKSKSELIIP